MLITDKEALKNYYTQTRHWQGIPSIEVTENGRIFVSFYSGGTTEEMGNYGALVVSNDGGRSFSEPIAVADMGKNARAYDCCLWIDPLKRLWFVWAVMPQNRIEFVICDRPDDDELVWSEVRELGYDIMLNKPTVADNGDWLFPCAVWKSGLITAEVGGADGSHPDGAHVFRSRDCGKTFELIGTAKAYNRHFDEHMLVQMRDGSLNMYIRSKYGVDVSHSTDGGLTWCEGYDCGFGGPNSRFYIGRLASGRLLLINHYRFKGRNNLTAMLSDDEGQTWYGHLLIDGRSNVSYPDAKQTGDGTIYITYDRERGAHYDKNRDYTDDAREILMAKVTEDDIAAGHIVSGVGELEITVSKIIKN